uniref:Olfactory receptor n=1 Tax=Pyxicephalus adspersus TaxID=30357 RepID=A0AAV3AY27_PYXAD|nr:TPA: hypothetical protein GDO54_008172 [Pyxicephalus adspersus]
MYLIAQSIKRVKRSHPQQTIFMTNNYINQNQVAFAFCTITASHLSFSVASYFLCNCKAVYSVCCTVIPPPSCVLQLYIGGIIIVTLYMAIFK